ncbi:hypothetical protein PQS91_18700 [Stenotrophomonas geniculata]|nr:hypothetical protein [Stenotrophomonas geniculata]MDC7801885.1 hypothetical protein [Stenotrophomonas geniculata]
MSTRPLFPQLHALIGDAAHLLPADVAERVEVLLDDPKDLLPALLARMDGRDAADGQPLDVQGASPAQAAMMAGLSRTLAGLHTLIQLLHAAELARAGRRAPAAQSRCGRRPAARRARTRPLRPPAAGVDPRHAWMQSVL